MGRHPGQLMGAGVESYHVDYRSGRATYYLPDGSTADFNFERPKHGVSEVFDGDGVRAAILGAQRGGDVPRVQSVDSARWMCGLQRVNQGRHVVY